MRSATRHRHALWDTRGHSFLKGPIPLQWLTDATAQGPSATWVGLECWRLAGLKGDLVFRLNLSNIRVNPSMARSSARRGLRALVDSELVSVARPAGQRVLVAIKPLGGGAHEVEATNQQPNGPR